MVVLKPTGKPECELEKDASQGAAEGLERVLESKRFVRRFRNRFFLWLPRWLDWNASSKLDVLDWFVVTRS